MSTKEFTKRLANSSFDINSLDQLSDKQFIENGIFSATELQAYTLQLNKTIGKIKESIGIQNNDQCLPCNYTDEQRISSLKRMVNFAKTQPEAFEDYFENFTRVSAVEQEQFEPGEGGPGCSFAFYACIALCSGASSGVGAALCVYLCACSFCKLKPPGC